MPVNVAEDMSKKGGSNKRKKLVGLQGGSLLAMHKTDSVWSISKSWEVL